MDRCKAIQIINAFYPADSQYPKTKEIGEKFLAQAKRECDIVYNWRDEPTNVLVRYAELCEEREIKLYRELRRNHRI